MNLTSLKEAPAWEWPEGAGRFLLDTIQNKRTTASDRLVAVKLAGDLVVMDDELAEALLSVLGNSEETETVRGQAAISLGPVLEQTDIDGFEDPEDVPISEPTFRRIEESLRHFYMDASVPKYVRRRILEAAVRAPQDWHRDAIRAAYASGDEEWRLTAVFCMGYIRGFDEQILESLKSQDPDVHYEAVCAAGNWELKAAWPHIAALVRSKKTEKTLLLAAIDAVAGIRPHEAREILGDLMDSNDEDIVAAVEEALGMSEGLSKLDDLEEEEDGDDEFSIDKAPRPR